MSVRATEIRPGRFPTHTPIRRVLRLCLASSSGGHLAEMQQFVDGLGGCEMFLVTVASPHSKSMLAGIPRCYIRRIERNPVNLVVNSYEAMRFLLHNRPEVVISTGSGDMLPLMLIAAARGIPLVFIESLARVAKPSLTGRIV